ncbi:MAG: hypothetical protein IK050_00750, partial [Lachnospiraceae bacterium]|nr:hypothetical protein [Lachnospiraceae bacterium]
MKKNLLKLLSVAMALVIAISAGVSTSASAGWWNWNDEAKLLKVFNVLTNDEIGTISEMIVGMTEGEQFDSIVIGDYVSAYNVDTQEVFFMYPVFCDGQARFVANVDSYGGVVVTSNTEAYNAIAELDGGNYLIVVDNGAYYAKGNAGAVMLYEDEYNMTTDVYSLDDYTYYQMLLAIMTHYIISFDSFIASIFGMDSSDTIKLGSSDQLYTGWWDWFWDWGGNNNNDNNNQYQTITKKLPITTFLRQGNYGICWACTVGTIVNYKTNYNVTGFQVADAMGIDYNRGATAAEMKQALAKYGLSYQVRNNKLSFSEVKTSINNDRPFGILLFTSNAGHAITGYG